MINLLPPEMKLDYRYARRNRRLVRWSVGLLVALAGLAGLTGSGLLIMGHAEHQRSQEVTAVQQRLASQNVTETEKQVTTISNNLKLMVTVLSKEILFSRLLTQLGSVTPPGTALTSLSISQTAGAIDITAGTKNYGDAAQLQANLADPANRIFSKADIDSISCSSNSTQNSIYPCSVTIKALFASDNPFLFINKDKAGAS
ncbi:MAG TPA: PilN domain-containing protein [Candidatus Saccharimonadales bacterium]